MSTKSVTRSNGFAGIFILALAVALSSAGCEKEYFAPEDPSFNQSTSASADSTDADTGVVTDEPIVN